MQIRNARYTADGAIDCEVEHPRHGWIPYTAREGDPADWGAAMYAAALASNPAPYEPPPEA